MSASNLKPAPQVMQDRVASNTAIGLLEVAFMAVISIVYVRLLLRSIGTVDYGIFTALGATGLLSAVLITGFNTAALRFLALAAGGDDDGLRRSTMASTVVLYLCIAAALFVIALASRSLVLRTLTIPDGRLEAAETVYWSVVGQFCFGALAAPFTAARQAHQRFGLVSAVDVGQRLLILAFLIVLSKWPTVTDDALRSVALVVMAAAFLRFCVLAGRTVVELPATRFRFADAELKQVRSIARFAKWSIANATSSQGRNHLAVLTMNVAFGTVVNAAYAIGLSTNAMVQRFSQAFKKSLQPAMTSLYGSDSDRDLSNLISVGCRYTAAISIAPLATVLVEMDSFLTFWLGNTPPNAALYARLIALATFSRLVSSGYGGAINATDRMRAGTIIGVSVDALTVIAGLVAIFALGAQPWVLPATFIAGSLLRSVTYATYFGKFYGFGVGQWFRRVVLPVGFSLLLVASSVWFVTVILAPSLLRLAIGGLVSLLFTAMTVRLIVSEPRERAVLVRWVASRLRRTKPLDATS